MTTRVRRPDRYRRHELAFDSRDAGHVASCVCGWPARPSVFLDVDDAHFAGAEHLARMAYRHLALRGAVPMTAPDAELWALLLEHRDRIGDEAQAVLDVVHECWPDRAGYRGGVGVERG